MFSRSETPPPPPPGAIGGVEPNAKKARNPLALAGIAGLLAILGAFLLLRALSGGETEVAEETADQVNQQVLVVTQPIPAGTNVNDILDAPSSFLSARAVPEEFVAEAAITSIEELEELRGLTLSSDALAGEQLLRGRFIDRSDFNQEGFIDRTAAISVPDGHQKVVLTLPTEKALGGNIRGGELVSVVSAFRLDPTEGDPFEVSVVVLPAVEVITVETDAEIVGQISADSDALGSATIGDVFVTLAVEPNELTDLTYSMEYGDIILAGALEGATKDDPRAISTISTIVNGSTLSTDGQEITVLVSQLEQLSPPSEESVNAGGTSPAAGAALLPPATADDPGVQGYESGDEPSGN